VQQKVNRLAALCRRAVRVKRRGKSSPAGWATSLARQTPPGARPNREQGTSGGDASRHRVPRVGPVRYRLPGRLLEAPSNRRPREMATPRAAIGCAGTKPGLQARSEPFLWRTGPFRRATKRATRLLCYGLPTMTRGRRRGATLPEPGATAGPLRSTAGAQPHRSTGRFNRRPAQALRQPSATALKCRAYSCSSSARGPQSVATRAGSWADGP
jgi:hypothetical protein